MNNSSYYITTTLPYVNAEPHIGFALEIIQADVLARFHNLILKQPIFFNTGTDEHGLKIYRKAIESGLTAQAYCDQYAAKFSLLKDALNISYNNFIRTTDADHVHAAQEFWKRCLANGDIYKTTYKVKYCVGCELEKTDSELVDGRCQYHPDKELELIEEENYFFRFSKYQQPLLDLYKKYPNFVVPESKLNEIISFVSAGLQDFSVSRIKSKMPWGIPVPDDEEHVMYVWFDALVNYISALGWPHNQEKFNQFWLNEKKEPQALQTAGKDNLRQQSAMWQAMLLSAGVPNSRQIMIHGFINVDGQKMSKSLGNVINPLDLVKKYGTDAVRLYLLAEIPTLSDGDFTMTKFTTRYNADLANGLGNLVSRIARLASRISIAGHDVPEFDPQVARLIQEYKFHEALAYIWQEQIAGLDKYINDTEPWQLQGDEFSRVIHEAVVKLQAIAINLQPFLPQTAEHILKLFSQSKTPTTTPLFPRIG